MQIVSECWRVLCNIAVQNFNVAIFANDKRSILLAAFIFRHALSHIGGCDTSHLTHRPREMHL